MKNNQFDTKRLDGLPIDTIAQKLGLQLRKNKCNCFIHDEKTPSFSIY